MKLRQTLPVLIMSMLPSQSIAQEEIQILEQCPDGSKPVVYVEANSGGWKSEFYDRRRRSQHHDPNDMRNTSTTYFVCIIDGENKILALNEDGKYTEDFSGYDLTKPYEAIQRIASKDNTI